MARCELLEPCSTTAPYFGECRETRDVRGSYKRNVDDDARDATRIQTASPADGSGTRAPSTQCAMDVPHALFVRLLPLILHCVVASADEHSVPRIRRTFWSSVCSPVNIQNTKRMMSCLNNSRKLFRIYVERFKKMMYATRGCVHALNPTETESRARTRYEPKLFFYLFALRIIVHGYELGISMISSWH